MATTFKALCDYADWSNKKNGVSGEIKSAQPNTKKNESGNSPLLEKEDASRQEASAPLSKPDFHYNIQIHLPDTRDEAVYDAIFKSLRKHIF